MLEMLMMMGLGSVLRPGLRMQVLSSQEVLDLVLAPVRFITDLYWVTAVHYYCSSLQG